MIMKKIATLVSVLLAAFACSPHLDPEMIPGSGNESQTEEPSVIHIQSIGLSETSLLLEPGTKAVLTATITPDNATVKSLEWTSSNEAVATISQSGEVTALSEGECTVTVSGDGKTAVCAVTVAKQVIPVASVSLSSNTESLLVGETLQLAVTVLPDNATDKTVVWMTSDDGVATVEDGLVTAVSIGEATITATVGEVSASCTVKVSLPFTYNGMCLESIAHGYISIINPNRLTIEYKVEDGEWTAASNMYSLIETTAGQRVWFRGRNESYSEIDPNDNLNYLATKIECHDEDFYLYGNLMSLVYGDDFEGKTELTGEHAFFRLFAENPHILNHPIKDIELPATTLSPSCYQNMFTSCTQLTRAPKLPAKVLTEACYASMFSHCSNLKDFPEMAATEMAYMSCTWMMMGTGIETAPELPSTNLAEACYQFMFYECPNLKRGPAILPATKLEESCYTGMFQYCENLEEAPVLPAKELKYNCYSHMFNGCKSLTKAPELPATQLANNCYCRMFGNSGLTEAPELPAMELAIWCYYYMFQNCTSLVKAPELPASTLYLWCYESMFEGCSSLNYIKVMASKRIQETWDDCKVVDLTPRDLTSYCKNWVNGVAPTGTFVASPDMTWDVVGPNGVPEGWTIQ